ncbi:MAG: hypothetical protein ISR82_05270 [Candidatus Marinimicrobia bacterium]|nr:hypothetical protein [Candidatus Neomarinimicrobiota bacterium]MBL7010611.1 hypothetical protein [Candidatus Neomarinimicrobiota bacterium]MBL7030096.1 hypothetical protein [Candidatus Neomarinimicrobiota bacterium]
MADCCSETNSDQSFGKQVCQTCGEKGKKVELATIRSLTRRDHPLYAELKSGFICTNPDDNTVYYSEENDIIIYHNDLVTSFHLKNPDDKQNLCYCFQHSRRAIKEDITKNGHSRIELSIREKVKQGACTCEVSNPKGKCCLGDVSGFVKNLQKGNIEIQHA